MARYTGPKKKLQRRFNLLVDHKTKHLKKRISDYGLRLEEKQKLKFVYGILEKQFLRYVTEAKKSKENTENALLTRLETRLDNTIYRLGYAKTRQQARQMVSHRQVLINGKKVNIPSYNVKTGEEITLDEKIFIKPFVQEALKEREVPEWLSREGHMGKVISMPNSADLPKDINIKRVLEFYSK